MNDQFEGDVPAEATDGNLFAPAARWDTVDGGWRKEQAG